MDQYLGLLRAIRERGKWKEQRAVLQSGERPRAQAIFGMQARYDLAAGFPLVTTKKVNFKLIAEELAWFLSGSTNNNDLKARGVTIWDEWADKETGELGPIYGQQWRRWECADGSRWDQITRLVADIRERVANPIARCGRRLILTAWNPPDMPRIDGTPACHTLAQFDVTEDRLSCQMYQRSADMFLGVPFNIASYALLTHVLAQVAGLKPGEFIHTFGDAHIYENHTAQVDEQLTRAPHPLPTLALDPDIREVDDFRSSAQATLSNYVCHPVLKGEVAI